MTSRSFDDIVGGECCGTDPDHVQAYDPSQATCCRGLQGGKENNVSSDGLRND